MEEPEIKKDDTEQEKKKHYLRCFWLWCVSK